MLKKTWSPIFIFLASMSAAAVMAPNGNTSQPEAANVLIAQEKAQGWVLLFDGITFAGWRGLGYTHVPPEHWIIENGAIKKVPTKDVPLQKDGQPLLGGDLMTIEEFEDFELAFDWKISPGGNSGVKYNVSEEMSTAAGAPGLPGGSTSAVLARENKPRASGEPKARPLTANPPSHAALGFEYQVLDDDKHPDAKNGPNRTAGALYDLIGPRNKTLKPVGEYNTAKIVFIGKHGEHWLNGVKVLEFDLDTAAFGQLLAKSKYKDIPKFAEKRKGHIVLQDHTDAVWYRNIKIRIPKK
ncbi:MAG: DUF1080 domain-containing protein [Candidatus Aminicenantes bacterium]|nr:DUF1080 domain-containing protein [Candidatus Aminicenantes bacterium]